MHERQLRPRVRRDRDGAAEPLLEREARLLPDDGEVAILARLEVLPREPAQVVDGGADPVERGPGVYERSGQLGVGSAAGRARLEI